MGLFNKKKRQELNYLELTPFPHYEYTPREDGCIDVLVPRFQQKFLQKMMPKHRSPYIKANLDKFGSATWVLINGENKVSYIADKLIEQFGEEIAPAEQRLTMFLTQLYTNGFISFNELKGKKDGKSIRST